MPWLETVRTIADWLNGDLEDYASADQGVNAKLVLVPLDGSDTVPDAVAVVDETRDMEAALKQAKAGVLMVRLYRETDQGIVHTVYRDVDVPITIGLMLDDPDTAAAKAAESYIWRAVLCSLAELNRNENASVRQRNSVSLLAIRDQQVVPADGKVGDREVTSAIRFTVKSRDSKPFGT